MKTVKQKMKEIRNSITNDIVNDNRFFILIYRKSYSIFFSRRGELDSGRQMGDGVCSRAAGL